MLYKLLQKRRSIRTYEPRPVESEKLDRILQAALLSPSSKGIRPWSFILVDDASLLKTLSQCKPHSSSFLSEAAFAVVVCADVHRAAAWIEDCSIAAIDMQIAIEEEGLGSCWIQIRDRKAPNETPASEFVKKTLNIPPHYEVEAIISAGYPAEHKEPYSLQELQWNKVYRNSFGKTTPSPNRQADRG